MKIVPLTAILFASSVALGAPPLGEEFVKIAGVPYTTAVAAAARSAIVCWVATRAGEVSLWCADGPKFAARRIVSLANDSGDVIGNLAISPDGRWVLYTRGPSSAPNGRTPNPAGLVHGLVNALWLARTDAGQTIEVAVRGTGASFAADSRRFIYMQEGRPELVEIQSASSGSVLSVPKTLFEDFGDIDELVWSPAGDAVAFVSSRPAHSLVGVYRLGDDRVHYVAPSVHRDMGLAWSPDGQKIAFLRFAGIAAGDVLDVLKDARFSILTASLTSAQTNEIYRSPGADANLWTDGSLHWLKDGRLVFLSDADGYSHLYAVDPATRGVVQLARGQCDQESIAVNSSGDQVAASGNCDDQARREISTWTLGTSAWARRSSAQSVATDPVFIGTGAEVFYRSATYDRAQTPAFAAPNGREELLGSEQVRDASLQKPEVMRLTAPDGTPLTAVWFAPRNVPRGHRAPGVVYVHGGPIRQMMPAWDMNSYYAYVYAANQLLASHGVGVLAINYRTGVGFGRAFRDAANYGPNGASELQDVIAAGNYLRARPDIDSARIGIYGGSYGGHLAANALARRSDLFNAGVAWHGIYDFTQWISNTGHPDRLSTPWGSSEATRAVAFESSALAHVSTWRSPTLLISGDDDRNVDFAETVTLYRALEEAGVPVQAYVLANEIHGFLRFSSWVDVIGRTGGFLLDHLAVDNAAQ